MKQYTTTNIRVSGERLQELKLKGISERKSLSTLIREAIDAFLGYRKTKSKSKNKDPFFEMIGVGEDVITDGSSHHDQYIYGRFYHESQNSLEKSKKKK